MSPPRNAAAVGAVAWEAVRRLNMPGEANSATMMWVAGLGVIINGVSALLFFRGRKSDANLQGAFIHLAGDAAISAGVLVAGAILWKTGWRWLDPVTSLLVCGVVLLGTWALLRDALHLAMGVRSLTGPNPGMRAAAGVRIRRTALLVGSAGAPPVRRGSNA